MELYEQNKYLITSGFGTDAYNDIIERWNEPHRFYHNLDHLNYLINHFDKLCEKDLITEPERSRLIVIAFFHDVIYDSKAKDNEKQSVDYFLEKLPPIVERLRKMSPLKN